MIMRFFLGCGSTLYVKRIPTKKKYLRRGIYDHTFEISNSFEKISVQFEVGELERTGDKSGYTLYKNRQLLIKESERFLCRLSLLCSLLSHPACIVYYLLDYI